MIVWCTRFWADNFSRAFCSFFGATGWGIHPTGIRWGRLFHAHGPVGLQRLRLSSDVLDLLFEDVASDVATLLATGFQSCVDHPQRLGSQTNPSVLRGTFPPWLLRRIHSCPLIFWNLLPQTSISSISSISSSQVTRAPLLGGLLPHPPVDLAVASPNVRSGVSAATPPRRGAWRPSRRRCGGRTEGCWRTWRSSVLQAGGMVVWEA